MKQISCNKEKVCVPELGLAHNLCEAVVNGLGPLAAPGPVTVRIHAPVDIGNVNKFHGISLLISGCAAGASMICGAIASVPWRLPDMHYNRMRVCRQFVLRSIPALIFKICNCSVPSQSRAKIHENCLRQWDFCLPSYVFLRSAQ